MLKYTEMKMMERHGMETVRISEAEMILKLKKKMADESASV